MSGNELSPEALERVFAAIAEAVDRAGPEGAKAFLARLTLLMAGQIGDEARVLELIAEADLNLND
ncbi:MAG TPA: hypothetical protein VET85_15805 [Stellaceae bacterium]|nr:hypothetical protein [Stellaceae bacterium]